MWRSVIQTRCEHGYWESEFGSWDGSPLDPWWFKPTISDEEFFKEVMAAGIECEIYNAKEGEMSFHLDVVEGSPWFIMGCDNLRQYNFTDPTDQLGRMSFFIDDYMDKALVNWDDFRVLMYRFVD
jgi:hypothetical protein